MLDDVLAAGFHRELQRQRHRVEPIGQSVEPFAARAREVVGVVECGLQRAEELRFGDFELGQHPVEPVHFALALFEQIAERRRVRPLRLLFERQHLARQQCDSLRDRRRPDHADGPRRGQGRHDLDRRVAGQRRRDQEPRVARDVDVVVDRHDHFDREVFG